MKLSTREDIEAPIEAVFRAVSNFDKHERQILRRGADVTRIEDRTPPDAGMKWEVTGQFRGKRRTVTAELMQFDKPNSLACKGHMGGIDGVVLVELLALSPKRTRMTMTIDLSANTVSAKLLLQSLKLAKGSVETRFKTRISGFAEGIGERYKKRANA